MASTESSNIPQSQEQLIKQLHENPELGKSLFTVLESLNLYKKRDNKKDKKNKGTNDVGKPKIIGKKERVTLVSKKSINKKDVTTPSSDMISGGAPSVDSSDAASSSNGSNGTNSIGTRSSTSRKKRGSRGSRRARRRRIRKRQQLQAEIATQLLAQMVGTQTLPEVQQTLPPPQQFFTCPKISPKKDLLEDPLTGEMRQVWSVTIPMVCHKTNTPFYAQCSTARHGYCSRCGVLRKGNKPIGSCCSQQGCGERLTAKYHRWYPGLIRLEPLGQERTVDDYEKHKDLFAKFNISWNNEDERQFVLDNYLLMKVFLVSHDFDVAPLHVERSYMIGVFAGRKFHTGALARKFLRDGLRLMSFRDDFPKNMKAMPDERAQVVEEMNQLFFQGRFRCYFHGHQSNIEGWYDPTQIDPATIKNYLQALCQKHTKNLPGAPPQHVPNLSSLPPTHTHTSHSSSNKSRFQYPKNPSRFAFAHQKAAPSGSTPSPISKRPVADSTDESDRESTSSNDDTPVTSASTMTKYRGVPAFQPAPVQYVPVYVSGGQQFMTMPVALPHPHPHPHATHAHAPPRHHHHGHHAPPHAHAHAHPHPHAPVAFQPYGMQPMQPMQPMQAMQPRPVHHAAPSYAASDTSSQSGDVYQQPPHGYGGHFVPIY